jgi:Tol biopolymer transport system component
MTLANTAAFQAAQAILVLISALGPARYGAEVSALRQAALPAPTRILFDSNRDGHFEIYAMGEDGSNQQRLTTSLGSEGPAWSPDRKRIAFTTGEWIAVMDAGGANLRLLARTDGDESGGPRWSPDGKKFALKNRGEIYIMGADGSAVRGLTQMGGSGSENPDWSPDGKVIAFDARPPGTNREIYVMDPEGRSLQRLTHTTAESSHPKWSPDGKRIVFQSGRDGNMEIYVMDADGAHVRKLSNTPVGRSLSPDWSPDGKKIVFASERDGNMEIYVMNVDGTNLRNLTLNRARDAHPNW